MKTFFPKLRCELINCVLSLQLPEQMKLIMDSLLQHCQKYPQTLGIWICLKTRSNPQFSSLFSLITRDKKKSGLKWLEFQFYFSRYGGIITSFAAFGSK